MHLDTETAALVVADELEQRGDARAALVRAQVAGQDAEELLRQHWAEWVGLEPSNALLRWKWGHLIEVAVRAVPAGWDAEEFLRKPTTECLARLALGWKVSSRGVEHARALRHLLCWGPFETSEVPTVETLTMDLEDAASVEALAAVSAPRLTALHTRASAEVEATLFRSLALAPWFATLETWSHRLTSLESLAQLLGNARLVARGGAGLVLLCDKEHLETVSGELRAALPQARFAVLPKPEKPFDPIDFQHIENTGVLPAYAPTNFRSLPPSTRTTERGTQSSEHNDVSTVGSGFDLGESFFRTCNWCGSGSTRGIYSQFWAHYSHFETTSYFNWEFECRDCGLFTAMRCSHTSG